MMNERRFNRMQTRRISRIPYANYFTWHNVNTQNNASELETSVIPENATTETDESSSPCTDNISLSELDRNDEREVSLLTEQIKDLRTEYISIQSHFITMNSISFCGYGVMLYYALKFGSEVTSINYLFLILPFLFGIGFMNILKYTTRMLGLGAYIAHLEETINSKVKKHIFAWHSKLISVNGYNFVGIAAIPCNLGMFAFVIFKFNENMKELIDQNQTKLYYALTVLAIVSILFILASLIVFVNQYHAVKYWSAEIYNSDEEVKTSPWPRIPPKKSQNKKATKIKKDE